jgi:hypothetical protein
LTYDLPNGEYELINANSPPFGNRTLVEDPPGGFDHPYTAIRRRPAPRYNGRDTPFIAYGAFGAVDPNINSPRIQQWNVTVEKQFGRAWQAEASYIGSYTERLWNQVAINPGVFLGLGACTLDGVFYPTCSTNGNLNQRRVYSLNNVNPAAARLYRQHGHSHVERHAELSRMKLSFQRRAGSGVSASGNYTLSRCYGDPAFQTGGFPQIANGYTDPQHPEVDRGPCDQDRTHIAVFNAGAQVPRLDNRAMRVAFSDWRVSGIFSARSGQPLNIISGSDRALTGIQNQRVDQILSNPYGDKTLNNWLNPAAFALPTLGTLGNFKRNSVRAPGFRTLDVAISRVVRSARAAISSCASRRSTC